MPALDAGPHTRTVDARVYAIGARCQQAARIAGRPNGVRAGGGWQGPELVKVSAAAERRPQSRESHLHDGCVEERDPKAFDEGVSHLGGEGVVLLAAVQGEVEVRALALYEYRGFGVGLACGGGAPMGEPAAELGAALQGGVHE